MFHFIRRVVCCVALLAMLYFIPPAATARADDQYDAYWQAANSPTAPDPRLDYNTYWAQVQAQQEQQWRQQ